jgi:uncharacterized protein (DUF58 family)
MPQAEPLFPDSFLASIERLDLDIRKAPATTFTGAHQSRVAGHSLDFRDFRAYMPGDDLRRVDWNVYRRSGGHLFVRRFDQPSPATVSILLDDTASMFVESPPRYTAAARVAAAIGYSALRNNDPLSVTLFSSTSQPVRRISGRRKLPNLLASLTRTTPSPGSISQAISSLNRQQRTGVTVVISDFFDSEGAQQVVQQLGRIQQTLLLIQISQPWDAHPEILENAELVDCETQSIVSVDSSSRILNQYLQAYSNYMNQLKQFAIVRGALFEQIDASAELLPQLDNLFPGGTMRLGGLAGTR